MRAERYLGHDHVHPTILLKMTIDDFHRPHSDGETLTGLKRSIPIPEQNPDLVGDSIADCQVLNLIAVKISNRYKHRGLAGRYALRWLESSVAGPDQDRHRV